MRIQHDRSELHFVSRLVHGLVRLDEHRVALVHVVQRGGVEKFQATGTASSQIVIARTDVADLLSKNVIITYGSRTIKSSFLHYRFATVTQSLFISIRILFIDLVLEFTYLRQFLL